MMTSNLFNQKILELHREFAIKNIHKSDFLIEHAARDIMENLELLGMRSNVDIHFRHSGILLAKYSESHEIPGQARDDECDSRNDVAWLEIACSDVALYNEQFDLILSCMNFHWSNDVLGDLQQLCKLLTPTGRLVMNFVGSGSLENLKKHLLECELKAGIGHSPHIIPLPKEEKVQGLFQQVGFKFVVVGTEKIELEYKNPITLMKDLKNMGENNAIASGIGVLPRNVFDWDSSEVFCDVVNLITVVAGK